MARATQQVSTYRESGVGVRMAKGPRVILLFGAVFWVSAISATPKGLHKRHQVEQSNLVKQLTKLASERPDLSLIEIVQAANKELANRGISYSAGLKNAKIENGFVVLRSEIGTVLLKAPSPYDTDGCGRSHAWGIPVKGFMGGKLHLAHGEQTLIFDVPIELVFARAWIVDPATGKRISRIPVPRERFQNPYGATADGKAVLWRVKLRPAALPWWRNVQTRHPSLRDKDTPFLTLRISEQSMEFVSDRALMIQVRDKVSVRQIEEAFTRSFGDYFATFDGAAFFSNGYFLVYNHPCT